MAEKTEKLVEGKVALVTGAAGGMGRVIAKRLALQGAKVTLTDLRGELVEQTAAELSAEVSQVMALAHDVSSEQDWRRAVNSTIDRFGELSILVNNAGSFVMESIEDSSLESWRKMFTVNVESVFLGTKIALGAMKINGRDRESPNSIINVSSVGGLVGAAFTTAYSSAKAAVTLLTKCAALECAKLNYAIRVNSIHPGLSDTPMQQILLDGHVRYSGFPSRAAARTAMVESYPLGRLGRPEDVADATLFLASDLSRYITGSELVVDGGLTAA
jgi:NAD(P)-dependent dehydrogenase (short-subunit alcohol dehydrogenase family)